MAYYPPSLFLPQAAATEGKCWKTRIEIVIREYHKWRTYFKKRVLCFIKALCQGQYSAFPVCVLFVWCNMDIYLTLQLQKHKDEDLSSLLKVSSTASCPTHQGAICIPMTITHQRLFTQTPMELTHAYPVPLTWFICFWLCGSWPLKRSTFDWSAATLNSLIILL